MPTLRSYLGAQGEGVTPGIHKMPMAAYLADPCVAPSLTAGLADTILRQSALHAKWQHPKLSPDYRQEEDTKFDIGTAAHSLILEGDDKVAVVEFNDWRTKAAQEQRDLARTNGMTPLLAKHYKAVKEMVAVAREFMKNCEIGASLAGAQPELTVIAKDGDIWLRARPDLTSKDNRILVNYKTCENASPEVFSRQIGRMGYDVSAAFYERAMKRLGHRAEEFFIAQEITPPYACSLHGLDPAAREIAEEKVELAIAIWAKCLKTGRWNGYPGRVHYTAPSSYEMAEAEERRLSADERIELATQG